MAIYGLVIVTICYVSYCILNAIDNGWLINKSQKTKQTIKTICKITGILSIIASIIGMTLIKIL